MQNNTYHFLVTKSSGEREPFQMDKYLQSLYRIGLNAEDAKKVVNSTLPQLHNNISTSKLYGITFNEIKKLSLKHASIYSLKEGLQLLGPSGFPFEHIVSQIFMQQGYNIERNQHIKGKCATHEIDVIAILLPAETEMLASGKTTLIEVKFHVEFGHKSDIKIPLYIKARFDDIKATDDYDINNYTIATNTKFTINATHYSACAGVSLIAWGYPKEGSIEILIDRYKLYPITILLCLTSEEKRKLINNNVVLYQDLPLAKEKKLVSDAKLEEIYNEYKTLRA